ncbi:hypothetical protein LSTR_LSTR010713 [Laodelphax striatellus]|uniref:Uncharacterized protein n=1 Tax=Laodelphax striatellus TaxID=195883 RepID=A0A482WYK7_LAOST|nr:hypothetical protein LSTR_LSTR010713 [Laodelphax striatellus]
MVFKLKVYDGVCNTMKEVENDRLEGYYKYLSREVWLCTSTTTTRRKTQAEETLYRVLNKVEILVNVREIETYDGVEVALKNSTKRVQINELKYFAIQKKEFVIVDGSIDIELDFIPYLDINDGVSKDEWDETVRQFGHIPMNLHYRLKDFDPEEVSADRSLIIGDAENKLYFNSDENVVMGDVNQTVTCKLMPNGVKPYPKFNVSGVANALIDEMTNVYNRTTHAKYFNAIDTEVRLCRSRNNKYVFVRVKTVQTLQKDGIASSIAKILPTQLDEAWIEMKGNDFDLKMVSIRYYTGLSKPKDVDYEGYVLMADTLSKWKSGSVTYIEAFTIRVEQVFGIDHTLQLRTRYTYTLYMQPYVRSENQNPITLWIGSKWTEQITAKNVICNEEELKNEETKLKLQTIVREELSNGTIINSNLTEYFDLLSTKLWKCTNEENFVMYRVMNHIQLKSVQARNLKKMIYFDGIYHFGITFGSELHFQIVEVKYLDRSFNIVYQFDGKVLLNNAVQSDTDAGVSPIVQSKYCCAKSEVTIYLKDETTYFLRNLEVYRLPTNQGMDNEKGLILEIGQAMRGYDVLVNYRIIIQDCKKQSQLKKDYLPKVVILQDSTAAKLGIDDYKQYFISEQEYYKCETAASKIQLVKNRLTLKDGYSMHAVYIHQGVKVNLETKSFVETKVYKKDKNEWFNFGGFYPQVSPPKDGAKATLESRLNYHLDFLKASTIVRTKKLSLEGINIEILSPPFNREINDTTKVECIRQMTDHTLTELLPEIKFAQRVGEGQFIWTRHDLKTSDYLTFEQEVWRCSAKDGYTKSTLYRVLNRLATMKEVASIYYSGAIAVDEKQLHPLEGGNNRDEAVIKYNVITDQKLVESLEGVTLKGETRPTFNYINYDYSFNHGRFYYRFFKEYHDLSSNLWFGFGVIQDIIFTSQLSAPRDDERFDALKDLMLYALIQFKKYGNDGGLEALPRVIANNGNLTTKIINKNAHRVFQIGSRYEKTVDINGRLTGFSSIPKVEEQIDDKYYELHDEDFHEVFQLTNLEVWLCTNQLVEFVRVVSTFKPKIPILAVTLYDSVQCEERPSINVDDVLFRPLISEIIYLNTTDSKVLRYDGALKFKPAEEYSTKSSTKTQSGLSKAFCCFQGK